MVSLAVPAASNEDFVIGHLGHLKDSERDEDNASTDDCTSSDSNSSPRSSPGAGSPPGVLLMRRPATLGEDVFSGFAPSQLSATAAVFSPIGNSMMLHGGNISPTQAAREAMLARAEREGLPLKVRLPPHLEGVPLALDPSLPAKKRLPFQEFDHLTAHLMLGQKPGQPMKKQVTGFFDATLCRSEFSASPCSIFPQVSLGSPVSVDSLLPWPTSPTTTSPLSVAVPR